MNTPICDFLQNYANRETVRAHMPGHKGVGATERFDLTEIPGAGVLYAGDDIIAESEANTASIFGAAKTLYSTEGASLAIRAMLYLARLHAVSTGKQPRILAGRNAHSTFLTACALLDLEVDWLLPAEATVLSCAIFPKTLENRLAELPESPVAVYITSPDYLGNTVDLAALAAVCHAHGCLLLVDNAHGAYLRFLPENRHPLALGADLCCDSAHKTLPVLTGGAYLHLAATLPATLLDAAESAMRLFASTSPSYLILQSLDACNPLLTGAFPQALAAFCGAVSALRDRLTASGYRVLGDEPLKLTLDAKAYGYLGEALAERLRERGIECEYFDPDVTVLMLAPAMGENSLHKIGTALLEIPKRAAILATAPRLPVPIQERTPREALLAPSERLPVSACIGRILAQPSVSCPPAVPIAICGERLTQAHLDAFRYYHADSLRMLRQA